MSSGTARARIQSKYRLHSCGIRSHSPDCRISLLSARPSDAGSICCRLQTLLPSRDFLSEVKPRHGASRWINKVDKRCPTIQSKSYRRSATTGVRATPSPVSVAKRSAQRRAWTQTAAGSVKSAWHPDAASAAHFAPGSPSSMLSGSSSSNLCFASETEPPDWAA